MGVKYPRECLEHLGEEKCKEFGCECCEAGGPLSHSSLCFYLRGVWLFGSQLVGCFGSVPVLPSHWWRHICAGRSGCSASIPAFMIARRCESRNTLYCTQTQKLMKLDCLPGHKFLNVYVSDCVCMHEWEERRETRGREGWQGGKVLLKASSRKRSSSGKKKNKVWPKVSGFLHVRFFSFTTAEFLSCVHAHRHAHVHSVFLGRLTHDDRRSKRQQLVLQCHKITPVQLKTSPALLAVLPLTCWFTVPNTAGILQLDKSQLAYITWEGTRGAGRRWHSTGVYLGYCSIRHCCQYFYFPCKGVGAWGRELVRPQSRSNVASLRTCCSVQLRSSARTRCTCVPGFLERFEEMKHKNNLAEQCQRWSFLTAWPVGSSVSETTLKVNSRCLKCHFAQRGSTWHL